MPPSNSTSIYTAAAPLAAGLLPRTGWLVPASLLFLLLLLSRWAQPPLGPPALRMAAPPLGSLPQSTLALHPASAL